MKCEHPNCNKKANYKKYGCGTYTCWEHRKYTKGYIIEAEVWNKMVIETGKDE